MKKPMNTTRNVHIVFRMKALRAVALSSLLGACVSEPDVFFEQVKDDDSSTGGSDGASPTGGSASVGGSPNGSGDGGQPTEGIGGSPSGDGGQPTQGIGGSPSGDGGQPTQGTGGGMGGDGGVQLADPTCPTPDDAPGWNFPPAGCPCHEGPLYTEVEGADGRIGHYPVECASAPSWSVLGGVCENASSYVSWSNCVDKGHGFNAAGEFVEVRGSADLPVLEFQHQDDQNPWNQGNTLGFKYNCHAGGPVVGTYDCGAVPNGAGGEITPGTYALTSLVQYGTPNFSIAGNAFHQTLLVTETSMALQSDDNAIFTFKGRYLYATSGRMITFQVLEASYYEAPFVPWTQAATFTATGNRLEIHSAEQGYVASFERVE